MRAAISWLFFWSTSYGLALVRICRISVTITVVAMPLATSPALYPPMPSARTTRPFAGSAAIESSLCERTIPGSVQVAISSVCVRSMYSGVRVLRDGPLQEAYQSFRRAGDDAHAEEPVGVPESRSHRGALP